MRDLCKTLNCSIGYIQKIENGLHRLDVLQFVRYCDAIGADVHEGISILENTKSIQEENDAKVLSSPVKSSI
jgi:transcriptional regulator with XRE-family HTH domain